MRRATWVLLCLFLIPQAAWVGCQQRPRNVITIFAASSLGNVLEELKRRHAVANPGTRLEIHLAGSSSLLRQLESGAPCDLFLSASREDLRVLEARGRVRSSRLFAGNELVLLGRSQGLLIRELNDLVRFPRARIAIGNPRTAPVGRYAVQALEASGLLDELTPQLVEAENARQVVAYVATGSATLGFAYRTDVALDARVQALLHVPPEMHAPIEYWIAALEASRSAQDVDRLIDFMMGDEAQASLTAYGLKTLRPAQSAGAARPQPRNIWSPIWISLRVALLATALAGVIGLALAAYLAEQRSRWRDLIAALSDLPLVLPPTVVGLGLLEALGPRGPIGRSLEAATGHHLVFSWGAAVLASAIMALPLMVRTSRAALESVPRRYRQAASTLGAGELGVFWSIRLPLAQRGVFAGLLLAFFRALGEFGATLMVAGNIPGRTQTLPLAIYSAVFESRPSDALVWVIVVATFSLLGAWAAQRLSRSGAS